jgi:hypothetical protein
MLNREVVRLIHLNVGYTGHKLVLEFTFCQPVDQIERTGAKLHRALSGVHRQTAQRQRHDGSHERVGILRQLHEIFSPG